MTDLMTGLAPLAATIFVTVCVLWLISASDSQSFSSASFQDTGHRPAPGTRRTAAGADAERCARPDLVAFRPGRRGRARPQGQHRCSRASDWTSGETAGGRQHECAARDCAAAGKRSGRTAAQRGSGDPRDRSGSADLGSPFAPLVNRQLRSRRAHTPPRSSREPSQPAALLRGDVLRE